MNVDDVVAERIAAARARIAAAKARRTTQAAARQAGLVHRHRAKLANLAVSASATTCCGRSPDPGVCPEDCGPGLPAGGHCACIHTEGTTP